LLSFESLFSKSKYDIVLVQGDTNTVFAAAMIASRFQIPVGHVEAGLRSGDMSMPEEVNRILVDHISMYLFATSPETSSNLKREGVSENSIYDVGNTIVDATLQMVELAKQKSLINEQFKDYILLTLHRPGNVDSLENLKEIIEGVKQVSKKHGLSVVFPVHPRTKSNLLKSDIKLPDNFFLLEPLGYLDFLRLQLDAQLIMTDSGGIQEESCILQVPCVTLRDNTERPETITAGANILGGINKEKIVSAADTMMQKKGSWKIPYGDGHSAEKILDIITN